MISQINTIVGGADRMSGQLLERVSALSSGLTPKLDSLDTLVAAVSLFVRRCSKAASPAMEDGARLTAVLDKSLRQADSLTVKTAALSESLDNLALGKAGLEKITAFKNKIDTLHEAIVRLRDHLIHMKISL